MAWAWASLMIVAARSASDQVVVARPWSSGRLVARATTATRAEGGKAPGSAGAGVVLQAFQAAGDEALAPLADGVAVAGEFVGDGLVGRLLGGTGAEDEAAAEGEGLGRSAGADEGLQALACLRGEDDPGAKGTGHERPPCKRQSSKLAEGLIMPHPQSPVQELAANL